MARFTNREYCDIHYVYGLCNGNAVAAVATYRHMFPLRRTPARSVFSNVHRNLAEHGTPVPRPTWGRERINPHYEEAILDLIDNDWTVSTRRIARMMGIPQATVLRVLRREMHRPFHVQRVQELLPGDRQRRLDFCQWAMQRHEADANFFWRVAWTDESTFTRAGFTNLHNLHFWAIHNPHQIREARFQYEFSINIWCGILGNHLLGPVELPARLNAVIYLNFLREQLPVLLEDVPVIFIGNMWLQQDGAPPHYGRDVRRWLDENYFERWIGRGGPINWPARSPDLNPIDFYLWGCMKEEVYATVVPTRQELLNRINNVANRIRNDPVEILRAQDSFINRCRACIRANGGHFEHLL